MCARVHLKPAQMWNELTLGDEISIELKTIMAVVRA